MKVRLIREPLLGVLAVVGVGLLLIWVHHPRKGLATISLAFAFGALARLLLAPRDAGLLVVRSKLIDVSTLVVLSAGVAALAVVQRFPAPGG